MSSRKPSSPTPPAERHYHHGDLRRVLIDVASELLERDGPEAVSFRAMARSAGVSQTAPYNHFQSKEHLLATVAEQGLRGLAMSQAKVAASNAGGEFGIVALGMDYIRYALERPQRYRLMFGAGLQRWRTEPDVMEAKSASFLPLRIALADHLGHATVENVSAEVDDVSVAAWALVHGLAMLLIDGALNVEDHARGKATSATSFVERVLTRFAATLHPVPVVANTGAQNAKEGRASSVARASSRRGGRARS